MANMQNGTCCDAEQIAELLGESVLGALARCDRVARRHG